MQGGRVLHKSATLSRSGGGRQSRAWRWAIARFNAKTIHTSLDKEIPMFELVRKSMLAGVGLALKAWDEVEDLAKEVAEQGKMTEQEGRKFIDDIQNRYDDAQRKLEERVEKSVKDLLKKADVVTQDELKALKKEIRELKALISSQEGSDPS
jgi:polyhydroxyalkanoate synthesis regulator phasin